MTAFLRVLKFFMLRHDMSFDAIAPFVKGHIELPCLFFAAAEWCPHCHSTAPAVVAAMPRIAKLGVKTYLVDADKNGAAIDALGVSGFPTILFASPDRRVAEYAGPRTPEGIVDFVRSRMGRPPKAAKAAMRA
jgi:thiol-disulfide isomerase/thioredoxin